MQTAAFNHLRAVLVALQHIVLRLYDQHANLRHVLTLTLHVLHAIDEAARDMYGQPWVDPAITFTTPTARCPPSFSILQEHLDYLMTGDIGSFFQTVCIIDAKATEALPYIDTLKSFLNGYQDLNELTSVTLRSKFATADLNRVEVSVGSSACSGSFAQFNSDMRAAKQSPVPLLQDEWLNQYLKELMEE